MPIRVSELGKSWEKNKMLYQFLIKLTGFWSKQPLEMKGQSSRATILQESGPHYDSVRRKNRLFIKSLQRFFFPPQQQ